MRPLSLPPVLGSRCQEGKTTLDQMTLARNNVQAYQNIDLSEPHRQGIKKTLTCIPKNIV